MVAEKLKERVKSKVGCSRFSLLSNQTTQKRKPISAVRMQLGVTADTTNLSYWLNWRVLLCAIWVLTPMVVASLMIWKCDGSGHSKSDRRVTQQDINRDFCGEEAWKPCLKGIHPIWLLIYRVTAFSLLLATLIIKVVISGGGIFYYYTQWTFSLLTIYFGWGSLLSIYGCFWYNKISSTGVGYYHVGTDAEDGTYIPLQYEEKDSNLQEENCLLPAAARCSYVFQAIFQMNAGAVMLTDCIYWLLIFPYFSVKDYNLSFMTVNMHTVNAVLLLGDAMLNCLQVPFLRISFFILWTGVFVIFQWTIHAFVSIGWPYPFLDLSSPYAPLWYVTLVTIVLIDGIDAYSMLLYFCPNCGIETLPVVKMVSGVLSMLRMRYGLIGTTDELPGCRKVHHLLRGARNPKGHEKGVVNGRH